MNVYFNTPEVGQPFLLTLPNASDHPELATLTHRVIQVLKTFPISHHCLSNRT
jgi:hypothetical protein